MKRIFFGVLIGSMFGMAQAGILELQGSLISYPGNENGYSKSYSSRASKKHKEYRTQVQIVKQIAPEIIEFSFSESAYGEYPFGYGHVQTVFGYEGFKGHTSQQGTIDYSFVMNDGEGEDDHAVGESLNATPVSEPKTWAIMLSGLVFLAYSARRRNEFSE